MRVAGLYINSVTAVGLIMSIGLVVDYNMHIVLTYFETTDASSREERVKKVITTMGKSILLGGFSTFLGVVPLAFSSTEIFRTFFVTFLGIVGLGSAHGLIFTPVMLSLIAPHSTQQMEYSKGEEEGTEDPLVKKDVETSSGSGVGRPDDEMERGDSSNGSHDMKTGNGAVESTPAPEKVEVGSSPEAPAEGGNGDSETGISHAKNEDGVVEPTSEAADAEHS
mmetsp:Transcript_21374/g.49328  ORF Transcript_21374/g.49328 Transcript_21374/m.49328 type:complete len:223 (+) Transcript_21374:1472-2140(+)